MRTTLNKLDVRVLPEVGVRGEPGIEILIDGTRLLDAVVGAELASLARGAGRKAIGGYGPLPWWDYKDLLTPGERYLLGCDGCGEPGCWPLLVTVTIADGLVTWSGFSNPFLRDMDYRDLGPFRFDEAEYRATWLAALDGADH